MTSAAGCIKAQWKGAETGRRMEPPRAFRLGDFDDACDRRLRARGHDLAAAIVIGDLRRPRLPQPPSEPVRRSPHPSRSRDPGGRHGAVAGRNRLLHRFAAPAQQHRPYRVIEKAPAAAKAEYSPSEWPATKAASFTRSSPASASRTRKARARLTAISAGCAFAVRVSSRLRPRQHQLRQLLVQSRVDFVEDGARRRKASASSLPMPTACDP